MKITKINITDIQPTQLYLSESKIKAISIWFNKNALSNFNPIPIKKLNDKTIFTDGHTRAWVAYKAGLTILP